MNTADRAVRIAALAERSSYIENVLCHSLVAELSSEVWRRDPTASLQVFNSEVDDSGFDLVLTLGSCARYIQLKQSHDEKSPAHCSVRLSFSAMPGSCMVLMSHSVGELKISSFRFFGGTTPADVMPLVDLLRHSKSPGRRNAAGERKVRTNYRDIPIRMFSVKLSTAALLDRLFPGQNVV